LITLLPRAQYGSLQPAHPKPGSDAQRGINAAKAPSQAGLHKAVPPLISVSAVAPDLLLSVQEQRTLNGISTKGQSYSARNGPARDTVHSHPQNHSPPPVPINAVNRPAQAPASEAIPTDLTTAKTIPLSEGDPFSTRQSHIYITPEVPPNPTSGGDVRRVNSAYISAGAEHGLGFTTINSGPSPFKTQGLTIDVFA